jgi:hypothetical protein
MPPYRRFGPEIEVAKKEIETTGTPMKVVVFGVWSIESNMLSRPPPV